MRQSIFAVSSRPPLTARGSSTTRKPKRQEENADEPWFRKEYADDREWRVGCWGPDFGGGAHMSGFFVADELNLGFAHLAASMGPQTAAPLAALLDAIAENTEQRDGKPGDEVLSIARAVLP